MNSTFFSVKEAADRVGVSRQTMFRYIKDGKLSATTDRQGQKQVELSELLRVFGELQQPETPAATVTDKPRLTRTSNATPKDNALIQVEFARLQAQLEIKTAELEMARERIQELKSAAHSTSEEKNRLLEIIERQTLLLAAPPPPAPQQVKRAPRKTKATPPAPKPTPRPAAKKSAAPAPKKKSTPAPAKPAAQKTTARAAVTRSTKTTKATTKTTSKRPAR